MEGILPDIINLFFANIIERLRAYDAKLQELNSQVGDVMTESFDMFDKFNISATCRIDIVFTLTTYFGGTQGFAIYHMSQFKMACNEYILKMKADNV